jgi:outer membrane protein
MMKHRFIPILLTTIALTSTAFSADAAPNFGIVNFGNCVNDSKLGKQEQASFEALKKQMAAMVEETAKQMNDIEVKFNDPEYRDGLSPEAEENLKVQFNTLKEQLGRYDSQYYEVMNKANMRIVQTLSTSINAASEKVAKEKKLSMVVNKDACFYYTPALDVTTSVVAEMDKNFAQESKKVGAQGNTAEAPSAEQQPKDKK